MKRFLHKAAKALTALAVATGFIMIPVASARAAGWQANEDDALLFDVRVGQWRVGDGVRGYQTDSGVCVDLADIIIAFDLPVRLDKKSRRATGWLFEESRTFTLDRESSIVQIVNKSQAVGSTDIRDVPEGWCVDTRALASWLNVDINADLANALLILKADRKLPFELAEERKARASKVRPIKEFDLSSLPQARDPYKMLRVPSVDVVASVGVVRDKRTGSRFDARYEIYASGELAGASFDARLSSNDRGVPKDLRLRAYRTDPDGGLLGPLNATHFALGDVPTNATPLGIQTTAGRGAFITNRPLNRPASFDRTVFRGELPDGWDAELYRNDQLIGYVQSRGDGRYEFLDVQLLYGQNRFEVVLYGPQGQIRRDVKMIPVGLDSIPPRETYYWAAVQDAGRDLVNLGGVDPSDYLGLRGGFGVERGIDPKTSVAASLFTSMLRGQRQYYLEGSVRRAIGPTLVELATAANLVGGYAVRGQVLAQVGQTLLSGESASLFGGYQSERYDRDLRRFNSLSLDHSLRLGRQYLPVRAELRYIDRIDGGSRLEAGTKLSFNIKQLNFNAELDWVQDRNPSGPSPDARLDASLRLSGRVGGLRLRGEAVFGLAGDSGFRESKVTGEWRAGEKSDWKVEAGYSVPDSRGRVVLGHTRRFRYFALTGQIEAASDGSVAAGLNLAFSLGPNPHGGGIRVASDKLASAGQAFATVFQDDNADGIRQPGEAVQKAVELTAGTAGRGAPTDDQGRTILDGLLPYEPVLIGIDASSLPDPFVQPATSGVVVTPRPGVPVVIELPLVSAGEISGTLQRDGGKVLSGVDLELLDKAGRVVKTTRSEFDGFFLFEFVPYGTYKLRVSALSANIVGVETSLPSLAELGKSKGSVDLGIVSAKPAQRIAGVANPAQAP
ncbi:MAG: carboxypeptidase regulatory-like domain-containing protein [Sphingomonadaceae bacterium]|nr:carboxypeptidase regulatory-like domain-containing protein [Sphingomonadaceae bacterium]